jgi:hypothetical protein
MTTTTTRAPGAQATSHDTGPARPQPIHHNTRRCPACAAVLDGGPVQFRCQPCRRGVRAADLTRETTRPLVPFRRATA